MCELDLKLAFAGSARFAKMSRMSCVRSMIFPADCLFDLTQLCRRELVVEYHEIDAGFRHEAPSVITFPDPRNVEGSGLGRSEGHAARPPRLRLASVRRALRATVPHRTTGPPGNQSDQRRSFSTRGARCELPQTLRGRHCSIRSMGIAPARIGRGDSPVASTIVDGGPPGVGPLSTRTSISRKRRRDVIGIVRRRCSASVGARRRRGNEARRHRSRVTR